VTIANAAYLQCTVMAKMLSCLLSRATTPVVECVDEKKFIRDTMADRPVA
jgi:hypothetical protein